MTHTTPFVDRDPTSSEATILMLAMSTYRDGTGQERESDGSTRPGWRDFERVFAEVLSGKAPENKDVFDVVVHGDPESNEYYGISLKSKQLARKSAIGDLEYGGRVHMELANSPAKFWAALYQKGIREADYTAKSKATEIGETLLEVVDQWHREAKVKYEKENPSHNLVLEKSVYITVSYTKPDSDNNRYYQVHSFSLDLPRELKWEFISDRCLRAYDTRHEGEVVFDWYGLSGGQLKFYPKAIEGLYKTGQFTLMRPNNVSILDKAEAYWPEVWEEAA